MSSKTLSWPQWLFLLVLCLADVPFMFAIARGVWNRSLDLSLFSYVANVVLKLCSAVLLVALFSPRARWFYSVVVLPLHVQLAFNLALVLIALVYQDGGLYTRVVPCLTDEAAWAARFSRVHTQDFFVHSWPALAALLVLLALQHAARRHVRDWLCACTSMRHHLYLAYCVLAGLLPFAVYAASVDWHTRYGIPTDARVDTLTIALAALAIGVIYWVFIVPEVKHSALAAAAAAPLVPTAPYGVWPAIGAAFARPRGVALK